MIWEMKSNLWRNDTKTPRIWEIHSTKWCLWKKISTWWYWTKNKNLGNWILPRKLTNTPWKSMVGRCICYWSSLFLGDMLSWESHGAPPNAHPRPPRNTALLRDYPSPSFKIRPYRRPHFLGGWHWGGPLDSHDVTFQCLFHGWSTKKSY